MAAIDRIYLDTQEQYKEFKKWCKEQPLITDKYGVSVPLTRYLNRRFFCAPCYVDAYLIKNCPFDYIQKELMINYGHWTQDKINEAYRCVKIKDKTYFTWLSESDFKIINGIVTMPNLEKSDYQKIKDGELFDTPSTKKNYEIGKHFRCTYHPGRHYNRPYEQKHWFIQLTVPEDLGYMWYLGDRNEWVFPDEFAVTDERSNTAFCKTIRALKRLIIKWKLPIGTVVSATGRYMSDEYEFVVTK